MIEKLFKLRENGSTIRTELLAGFTTFLTMAYILAVNPDILGAAGMDRGAVFTATALSACVATLVMAFAANLPFALAPGMGLNAFFAYTVCLGMGHTWQFALTAVLIEGLIFVILTACNVREWLIHAIPHSLKQAISVGIGVFIAFIGLQNAGVLVSNPATIISLVDLKDAGAHPGPVLALVTVCLVALLLARKVRGALLIGMLLATLAGIPLGVTTLPDQFDWSPPSLAPLLFQFEWGALFSGDMVVVVFTFLFMDLFDTLGTLIGVSTKAGMLDEEGRIPRVKPALFADAIGTTLGAVLGTSTVTTYVESASGVAEGGRTGLTALSAAVCFLLALVFAPVFLMIPPAATASALVVVGAMMMTPIASIRMDDMSELVPVFLTVTMIPFTYSIAEGIAFGMISYVVIKVGSGRWRDLNWFVVFVAAVMSLRFVL
ncbi:MAG: NCS2 family permease [Opitutales bacterium]|nr:NCS2 family permease [Opitutales bacterium]